MFALALALAAQPAKLPPFDVLCRQAPTAPYARNWKWLELPIKAICTADTDGGREVPITAAQIQRGLVFANAAYARARIRFVFDPKRDFIRVRSTLLNRTEAGDKDANEACQAAAEKFPGYAVLVFRWGGGKGATGGCYSGFAGKYVVMCQYWESPPPVPQNIWLIGHEVGHYLGLDHPFGPSFGKVAEAEKYFKENKDDPACFDGDGLPDTLPDPCIGEVNGDEKLRTVTLDGKKLTLDRENLMNYTGSLYKTVSRAQALRLRWSVANKVHRLRSNLPSNAPTAGAFLFKDLKTVDGNGTAPVTTLEKYENGIMHGGGRVTCAAKVGSRTVYEIAGVGGSPEPSTSGEAEGSAVPYRVALYAYSGADMGVVRIAIDGRPVGKPLDLWNPVTFMPTGAVELGTIRLKAGAHRVTVEVVGKNREAIGANWSAEALELIPVGAGR